MRRAKTAVTAAVTRPKRAAVSRAATAPSSSEKPADKPASSSSASPASASSASSSASAVSPAKKPRKAPLSDVPDRVAVRDRVGGYLNLSTPVFTPGTLRVAMWNVNGIRAVSRKGNLAEMIDAEQPDVLLLNEVKAGLDDVAKITEISGVYPHTAWAFAEKKGYSGVGVLSKTPFLRTLSSIPQDTEGRSAAVEFPGFVCAVVYSVNSQSPTSVRHQERLAFDERLRGWIKTLQAIGKPLILMGDLNVARNEIDLARPKTNQKTAGFIPAERQSFEETLKTGLRDVLRERNPDQSLYSYYSQRQNCRAKDIGWRVDYFLTDHPSPDTFVKDVYIRNEQLGSDHMPVVAHLTL